MPQPPGTKPAAPKPPAAPASGKPKIVDDEDTMNMSEITLSYTFYRTDKDAGNAASTPDGVRR